MGEYTLHATTMQAINMALEDRAEIVSTVSDAIRTVFHAGNDTVDTPALKQDHKQLREGDDKLIEKAGSDATTSEELDTEFSQNTADLLREQECATEETEDSRIKAIIQAIRKRPACSPNATTCWYAGLWGA